ncbi:MAG: glycosyltransferase [Ruminococcus flavefaciens]|nr:glycosyltransferase [Ruminococcus flavefaciens]
MPEISIIIPVFNAEKYLDRCMNSIVNQTFKDIEVILIDDGSQDCSAILCDDWKKKDNRVIVIHKKNAGAGAARNTGLKVANGRYIGFVDSDDWVDINMYQILFDILNQHKEADIAMCRMDRTSNEKVTDIRYEYNVIMKSRKEMLKFFFRVNGEESEYGVYTKLIKKEMLKDFSFIEGTISEDVMASYYFYTNCEYVACTDLKLYHYFDNHQGVTKGMVTKKDLEYINAFYRIIVDIQEKFPEFTEYAEMNYIRANFTILSKMRLYGFDKSNKELVDRYYDIKKIVRQNFKKLMRWKMPFSRKILLILDCI